MPRGQPIAAVALAVDTSDDRRKLSLATAMKRGSAPARNKSQLSGNPERTRWFGREFRSG
jgi:hypothetical protein